VQNIGDLYTISKEPEGVLGKGRCNDVLLAKKKNRNISLLNEIMQLSVPSRSRDNDDDNNNNNNSSTNIKQMSSDQSELDRSNYSDSAASSNHSSPNSEHGVNRRRINDYGSGGSFSEGDTTMHTIFPTVFSSNSLASTSPCNDVIFIL
jgi:hypothetical protein